MSSFVTRQTTPGPSSIDASSVNSRKRASIDDVSHIEARNVKKLRGETAITKKDKKKRKKKKKKMPVVTGIGSISKSATPVTITSRSVRLLPTLGLNKISYSIREISQPPSEPSVLTAMNAKANEAIPAPVPDTSIDELEQLKGELVTKSALIHTHENAMSQVQQNITCQICLDLLYKPYALAPCGHIACYSCLMSWFSRPTEEGADAHQRPIYLRRKTCPHCRATVRDPPVEVWAIKHIVGNLVGTGLLVGLPPLPTDQPVASSSGGAQTGSGTESSRDLWKNVFYPDRSSFLALASREDAGIRDEEDGGVYRCVDCMHEISGGICTHCHRIYRAHDDLDFGDDIDDDDDEDVPFFGMAFDNRFSDAEYDQDDENVVEGALFDIAYRVPRWARNRDEDIDISGSESEGEEDSSMAGFIDDSESHGPEEEAEDLGSRDVEEVDLVNLDLDYDGVAAANSSQGPTEVIELSDDDDENERPTRPARRRGVNRAQTLISLLSDEDDEGEGWEEEGNKNNLPSDEDSEEFGNDEGDEMDNQEGIHSRDEDDPNVGSVYWDDLYEHGDIYRF